MITIVNLAHLPQHVQAMHFLPVILCGIALSQKDDIEVRICTNQGFTDEAVAVDRLQLFVR